MKIRVVLPVFEVRQYTGKNAIELAQWLAAEAERLGARPQDVPKISWARFEWGEEESEAPVLIAYDPNYMTEVPVRVGRWIGWGYPRQNEIHIDPQGKRPIEGLKLCLIDGKDVDVERFDLGIEEVRVG